MAGPAHKKPAESKPADDLGLYLVIIFVVIMIFIFGAAKLSGSSFLNADSMYGKLMSVLGPIGSFLVSSRLWYVVGIISSLASLIAIAIIVFSLVRMREIQLHEKAEIKHEISLALARDYEASQKENPKWRYILDLIESPTESDWRMAIIEADNMMDELLIEKGYSGDSLGERLKNARSDAFLSINNAWDAHEIRNKIAHQGSDFPLSQLESRRVMRLYETVFEEFGLI